MSLQSGRTWKEERIVPMIAMICVAHISRSSVDFFSSHGQGKSAPQNDSVAS